MTRAEFGAAPPNCSHARQNVVLERGFFVGVLRRDRVAVLYEQGVELPSDLQGVAWIPLDSPGDVETRARQGVPGAAIDCDLSLDPTDRARRDGYTLEAIVHTTEMPRREAMRALARLMESDIVEIGGRFKDQWRLASSEASTRRRSQRVKAE